MREGLSEQLTISIDKERFKTILIRENKSEKVGGIAMIYYDTLSKINIFKYAGNAVWHNGVSYTIVDKDDLEGAIFTSMRNLGVSDGVLNEKFQAMYKTIWRDLSRREFKLTRRKIIFNNCVLDTDTMQVSPFSPEHHVINKLNYDYDPDAQCPKWNKFLEEVLPDTESRESFQDFLGLAYCDRVKYKIERFMILIGKGSNGKSVVYETITSVVGEDNTSTYEISDLLTGNSKDYNIASIDGKTINYCSELKNKEVSGEAIKKLISGEPIQARHIYRDPFMVRNLPLLIANGNELPPTSDHTKGFFRRLHIIPFNVTIPDEKQNLSLHTELKEELPGILNWILVGRRRIEKNGFKISESEAVKDAVHKYKIDSNSILKFLEEVEYCHSPLYKNHPPEEISASDFYQKYKNYCHESGNVPFSLVKFGEKLVEEGYNKKRKMTGQSYTIYKMPLPNQYDALVSAGRIVMGKDEYMKMIGYRNGSVVLSEEPEREYKNADQVLF